MAKRSSVGNGRGVPKEDGDLLGNVPSPLFSRKNTPSRGVKRQPVGVLEVVSFFSGAAIMVMELTGSRCVAPYFGTSLVVWTSLIGVVLASLCCGNWLGGALADKTPSRRVLARVLLASSFSVAALAVFGNGLFGVLASFGANLYLTLVVAAVLAFSVPSVLLGMVSPFVVRLALQNVASSGHTVGRFVALSSAGSILGTFMAGFGLIPFFSSGVILLCVATMLAVLSALLYLPPVRSGVFLIALLLSACAAYFNHNGLPFMPVGVRIDTPYNQISVVESNRLGGRRVRVMMTDASAAQSLMYTDAPEELVSDYTKFYDLAFYFKPDTKRILMLGGGGYAVPRHVLATHQNVSMDVVELDPGVTETARRYFHLKDDPRLCIFHEDARTYLNRVVREEPSERYDAIFMDVFGSWYNIPFHLTTVETARLMHHLLTPDGVLIVNVISSLYGNRSGVFHGIYAALATSFPRLLIFPASASAKEYAFSLQNLMIVAFASKELPSVPAAPDARIVRLLDKQWNLAFQPLVPAFTDAFAPVERYTLSQRSK